MKCPTCGRPLTPNTVGECPDCDGPPPTGRAARGLAILGALADVGCLIELLLVAIGVTALIFVLYRFLG
jgi:hypothetical protein